MTEEQEKELFALVNSISKDTTLLIGLIIGAYIIIVALVVLNVASYL